MKQKHWILVKYLPASAGVTLKVAVPVTGLAERFVAVKNTMSRAPTSTVSWAFSGLKVHGSLGLTLASKSTRICALTRRARCSPRCVVPFKPVTWQNSR